MVLFIYFLERGEGREKERERNINVCLPIVHPLLGTWPATQACALTGNQNINALVHRLPLSPLSHTSQGKYTYSLIRSFISRIIFFRPTQISTQKVYAIILVDYCL